MKEIKGIQVYVHICIEIHLCVCVCVFWSETSGCEQWLQVEQEVSRSPSAATTQSHVLPWLHGGTGVICCRDRSVAWGRGHWGLALWGSGVGTAPGQAPWGMPQGKPQPGAINKPAPSTQLEDQGSLCQPPNSLCS